MEVVPRKSEARLRRAIRQMRRSGRRMVRWSDGWRVVHCGAVVAELSVEEGAHLVGEHHVVEAQGGGMVLAASEMVEEDAAPDVRPSGPWVFAAAGKNVPRGRGRSFDRLAHRASEGAGPLTLRHVAAGLRLIEDAECAMRLPGMTMDWSGLPADKRKSWRGYGGLSASGREATRRIEKVRDALGADTFDVVWALCIRRRSVHRLAAELGITVRLLNRRLTDIFEAMAGAYEG